MKYNILKDRVKSIDNIHELYSVTYLPENPKGIIHVVHGMTEYIDRYSEFMEHFANLGYICCGYDHLGHGHTVFNQDELGFISNKNGWRLLVDDVYNFSKFIKEKYPNQPYYLMGHSMGSFIVRLAESSYHISNKLIIMGTGAKNPIAGMGIGLSQILSLFKGNKGYSTLLNNAAFGAYNKKFGKEDKFNWLNTIKEERDIYRNDPLCNYSFTICALRDLVKLNKNSGENTCFRKFNKDLPILLVSGKDDPVGDYGKGVIKIYNQFIKNKCNAKYILYEDCRHEILKDIKKDNVISDIEKFIS